MMANGAASQIRSEIHRPQRDDQTLTPSPTKDQNRHIKEIEDARSKDTMRRSPYPHPII
jgi:hypothetical protein